MNSKAMLKDDISSKIYIIRGQKVILDRDLAQLYHVTTFNLNKAVTRNIDRFPKDFMFRLNKKEFENLKFHFGISRWGGTRKLPRAFTEQGVAMLSSVLHSKRAVLVNIAIIRAFVKLRETLSLHKEMTVKLKELERKVEGHDESIHAIFDAIRKLMLEEEKPKKSIGYHAKK